MKRLRMITAWGTVLALIAAAPAFAKGPADLIVITGPGIDSELRVDDTDLLEAISSFSLEQVPNSVAPLPEMDEAKGYRLQRFGYDTETAQYVAWDTAIYYPDPSGKGGLVYYVGLVNGSSEYDGRWFRASREGDAAMRRILANVMVASRPPAADFPWGLVGGGAAMLVLLGGVAWAVRSRLPVLTR